MEAFLNNIDALEKTTEALIQKWKELRSENKLLKEKNKELEEKIQMNPSDTKEKLASDTNINLLRIEQILDKYVERIDVCLELINIEMNGK